MKLKDWSGKSFDNFSIIKRADDKIDPSGRRRINWLCVCNCGNEFITSADKLNSTKRFPIGCNNCVNLHRSIIQRSNNIGKKYGRLTIIDIKWEPRNNIAVCQCECGNVCEIIKSDVTSGHTKSCGCLQIENASKSNVKDWTGVISDYGIELLSQDHKNKNGQWIWNCKCGLCNSIFKELPAKIFNGHTTSCGCRKKSSNEELIESYLIDQNIAFKTQYTFEKCKLKNCLPFDFAIFNNDILIGLLEYDGRQHYEPIDFFGGKEQFKLQKKEMKLKHSIVYHIIFHY